MTLRREVGKGNYGTVWRAKYDGDLPLAVKIVRLDTVSSTQQLVALMSEAAVLSKVRLKPNVVSYMGSRMLGRELWIAQELAGKTLLETLQKTVKRCPRPRCSEEEVAEALACSPSSPPSYWSLFHRWYLATAWLHKVEM